VFFSEFKKYLAEIGEPLSIPRKIQPLGEKKEFLDTKSPLQELFS